MRESREESLERNKRDIEQFIKSIEKNVINYDIGREWFMNQPLQHLGIMIN